MDLGGPQLTHCARLWAEPLGELPSCEFLQLVEPQLPYREKHPGKLYAETGRAHRNSPSTAFDPTKLFPFIVSALRKSPPLEENSPRQHVALLRSQLTKKVEVLTHACRSSDD